MTAKRPRDWFYVIRTLMRYGISLRDIGKACSRDHTTVEGWQNGSEPKESDARVVLGLMARHAPVEYIQHQRQYELELVDAMRAGLQAQISEGA